MHPKQFDLHAQIEDNHWWFVGRRNILRELIIRLVAPCAGAVVLDLGCGTGGMLGALSSDYRCFGLDSSPDAIALARRRFPDVRFIEGTVPDGLAGVGEPVSMYLLLDVIEHIRDDRSFMRSLVSAMEPGSLLLVTVPADMALWSPHDVGYGHFRRYDASGLRQVWAGEPLGELFVSHFNMLFYPAIRLIRMLNNIAGKPWGKAGTDLSVPPLPVNRLLTRVFSLEAPVLCRLMQQGSGRGLPFGVSLVAVLRRERD